MRTVDERTGSRVNALKTASDAIKNDIRVAVPGIVEAWDALRQTVTVQPAIREKLSSGGAVSEVNIPLLVDVPVVMPRGGGFGLAFAPQKGDECLVVFADNCIDSWWQSGGVQSQADSRRHDLSDGFAILGCWSQPRRAAIPPSGIRLQNDSGTIYARVSSGGVELSSGGATVAVSGGEIRLSGTILINGVDIYDLIQNQGE